MTPEPTKTRRDMFARAIEAASRAAHLTLANNGGTFRRTDLQPMPGTGDALWDDGVYAVGIGGVRVASNFAAIAQTLLTIRAKHPNAPYIGTWIDNGIAYVDAVVLLPDRESALIVARAFAQRAIYNGATGETVEVTS